MKCSKFLLILCLTLCQQVSHSQCSNWIIDNAVVAGNQLVKTKPMTLVVRGNYTYSIEFKATDRGIQAKMVSKAGVEFNQDDEVIFMDRLETRKSYRFTEMGELKRVGSTPIHENLLQMDMAAIKWMNSTPPTTIYIKSNTSNEMRKFTVNPNRQAEFTQLIKCFYNTLDPSKVKDIKLEGNDLSARSGSRAISSTSAGPRKVADISLLNDKELGDLKAQLAEAKIALKTEIENERKKADQIKSNLKEEVAAELCSRSPKKCR